MSNVTQTSVANVTATLTGATNIKITNFTIGTINSEVSHTLQANLKQLRIRHRDKSEIKYAFTSGESDTKYFTIFRNTCEELINLSFNAKVLYFQADKVGIVEIMELY